MLHLSGDAMNKILPVITVIFFISWAKVCAQDPQFSQYYAAPLYLNPAFAGTSAGHRFTANYRNQWPSVPTGYATYAFSYDYHLADVKSGIGLLATVDQAGSANLRSTSIGFLYSYKVQISNHWVVTPGLYFGYSSRDIDFNKLIFGDQLEFESSGGVPSDDPSLGGLESVGFFDFGTGFLAYNQTLWLGVSAHHINRPNQSLIGQESEVPIKTSIHGGIRIPLYYGPFKKPRTSSIAPSFVYKNQGAFDQLDLGLHFLYEPVVLGLWYRGIPVQQNAGDNISQDAVTIVMGMKFQDFEVGYSYDFTVSELGPISGGAHEVSLQYNLEVMASNKPKKRQKYIPCPTFIRQKEPKRGPSQ